MFGKWGVDKLVMWSSRGHGEVYYDELTGAYNQNGSRLRIKALGSHEINKISFTFIKNTNGTK